MKTLAQFDVRDIDRCATLVTEDFVWHFVNPERPDLAGAYPGISGLKDFFARLMDMSDESFEVVPVNAWPIGDELVIAQTANRFDTKEGRREFDVATVWRFRDGKVCEVWDIPSVYAARIIPAAQKGS